MRRMALKVFSCGWGIFLCVSCAGEKVDPAKPAPAGRRTMSERMNEGGGYKQDEDGKWVPKSDKRSEYDGVREPGYFKGNVEKDVYKTGDFTKSSWQGGKDFGLKRYEGNTDGSRFQTTARQDGQVAEGDGQRAEIAENFRTNTLAREGAREADTAAIGRPMDAVVEGQRGRYKAPAVIDWQEQRGMSMEESRGILGR